MFAYHQDIFGFYYIRKHERLIMFYGRQLLKPFIWEKAIIDVSIFLIIINLK